MPIVELAEVRDRLRLPLTVPDDDVQQLRDSAEGALVPLLDDTVPVDGTAPAIVHEAVLNLCKEIWSASRHAYDSGDFTGFSPMITSNMLHRYSGLFGPVRDTSAMLQ